uniref:Zinc finger PHD-type domain-containing protein n=1 Tax=Solanum tuberosum TaxID=4113 RepID=M1AQG8_SOLTU
MAKKRGRKTLNKIKIAEDWCFECKDGEKLMICDFGDCLEAYHPACVGENDSLDKVVCSRCIGRIDFVLLKRRHGFCNNCLKLALLVEEDKNIDSDGESVDLRDRETNEGLFREYYEIVKEKEGFDKNSLLAGKTKLNKEKICQISSDSDKRSEKEDEHSEEEDEQISSDNGDFSDREPQKKRLKKKRRKEECDDLKEKVKEGLLEKQTIVELEQKAKILHEDITKHRIARELELLQKLIDRANEKGWRHLFDHLEKRKLLHQASYLSFVLPNIPAVIPEEVELESLDRNDNQMHQCSDETTPMKQNIPGATPEKVELEPLSKDEKDVNQMHQYLDETTLQRKILLM